MGRKLGQGKPQRESARPQIHQTICQETAKIRETHGPWVSDGFTGVFNGLARQWVSIHNLECQKHLY